MSADAAPTHLHAFLTGGGELARLIAAFDWASTPVGPIDGWPAFMKAQVGLFLRSPVPIVTLWGEQGVMIYNDAYSRFAGARHPSLLGSNVLEGWPEVADFNANVMRVGLAGGTLAYRDQELALNRRGVMEPVWLDLDYSPILDESGLPTGVMAIVVDVSDKIRAQHWLTGERERLARMFDQAPGFMAVLQGPDHVFEMANPAYVRLIGGRDPLGKSVRDALPELVDQGFIAILDEVYATGRPFSGASTSVMLHDESDEPSEHFVDFVFQPLRDSDGAVAGIFVEGSDITARIRSDQQVRLAVDRLRRAQEAGGVGVFTLDIASNTLSASQEFCRIFGLPFVETMDASVFEDAVLPEDAGVRSDPAGRRAGQSVMEVEYRIRRADTGEIRYIYRRAEFERDADRRPVRMVGVVQDVTERRLAQQALEAGEAKFRTFAQAVPNQLWTATPDGRLDWFNDQVFAYTGLGHDELAGDTWTGMVHPEDLPRISAQWAAALESGDDYSTEFRLRRHDGAYRWHLVRALPLRDADGGIRLWLGANTDIHEQKQAEVENVRDRNRLWAMSHDLLLVSDLSGRITSINPSATRLLGWEPEEMVGRLLSDFVHPDDLGATAAEVAKLAAGAMTLSFENRCRTKTGGWRLLGWSAVRDGERIHGVARDITEERALTRNQERIWNLSPVLKLVASPDGVLRQINPAWTAALGWTQEASTGRRLKDFVIESSSDAADEVLRAMAAGQTVDDAEFAMMVEFGDERRIGWTFVPEGDTIYGFGRDLTEQRRVEDALRQAQKMEAVGQLTGGIAHDFNNLLQGITGSLDLVQKRIGQGRLSELDRFISGAMTSANRAASLTHRLLAFSRRQPLDPRPVRVNPLVASMEDLLRRTLGERIDLEMVLGSGVWLTRCDANQLESAILNLVINARDAMPEGGRLVIETDNAHLDAAYAAQHGEVRAGDYVCISVADTGAGMSPETLKRAFEPFFTTKPLGQGTGLGLSMIYGFAQQSEGYAKIDSEQGQGTTFRLYLPRFRGDAADEEPGPHVTVRPANTGETVLVVEDEPVVRGLIVEILNDLGYHAIEAHDGPSGVDVLKSNRRIDLLITDIGLPGLNGRQVAEAGRKFRPGLKVLFMTGYAENAALAAGFLEPGMAMVTKPFAMEVLTARIREIIEGV